MIRKIDHTLLGTAYHTWLQSLFHFSYADYYQPYNRFGVVRVINDDVLHAGGGHDLHQHRNVEVLTYVLDGCLTHMPKKFGMRSLERGDLYYMTSGTGIEHGEFNWGDTAVRMIQLWIVPDEKGLNPDVKYAHFNEHQAVNEWHLIASKYQSALIKVHQDVNISLLKLEPHCETQVTIAKDRQAYLIQLEGSCQLEDEFLMEEKDGLEIYEDSIQIKSLTQSHLMLVEMKIRDDYHEIKVAT